MRQCEQDFIRQLIVDLLELPHDAVFYGYQDNPKPRGEYAVLNVFARQMEASQDEMNLGEGKVRVITPWTATLSITLHGARDPASELEHLASSLCKPTVVERCAMAGVAFYDFGSVADLSDVSGPRARKQAVLDVYVRWNHVDIDEGEYIEKVLVSGKLTD